MESLELMDDEALLQRYAGADDRDALDLLFRRHVDAAYATALRLCWNAADAEDAVQAAFVQVMKHSSSYPGGRGEQGVKMWMLRIVANMGKKRIRTEVRRRRREETVAEDQDGFFLPDEPDGPDADLREKEGEVLAALDSLPTRFRSAIWLHLCQGLPRTEAAAALGLPERTLDNQIQYGMKKLRETLARSGVSARLASLSAFLPLLSTESAPPSLVAFAVRTAHAPLQAVAATVTPAATTGFGGLALKVAAAGVIMVATGVGVAHFAGRGNAPYPAPIPPASPPPGVNHRWVLDTPGLPSEWKVLRGAWTNRSDEGVSNSGCIQLTGPLTVILFDLPMERLPVVVSYRTSPGLVRGNNAGQSKVSWSEYLSAAEFNGLGAGYRVPANMAAGEKLWITHHEYVTESFVYRWDDQGPKDLCVFKRTPGSQLVLGLVGLQLLDDVSIESVRSEDIPDASPYLKSLEGIPPERRLGAVPLPKIKPGHPGVKQVTIRFDGPFSFLEWARTTGG